MPLPTVFHSRTSQRCTSLLWKEWAGYHAVCSYGICHEPEYMALRHSAGLIDVSPLFKLEIRGPGAADFLTLLTVRDVRKLRMGRMVYLCWCDDDGKVIDDGTVARLGKETFRLTAAEPSLAWLTQVADPFDVEIQDVSDRIGALALQGPRSREILQRTTDADLTALRYFGIIRGRVGDAEVEVSRTGYTGDLGYEIWVQKADAEAVYDSVMSAGRVSGLLAVGLDAMDVTRVEAGLIMNGVDYWSAHHCLTDDRKTSPWELGLGWTVNLDREPFVGQAALRHEKEHGSPRTLVGLVADWDEIEALFDRYGLTPEVPSTAWRDGRPVYDPNGRWIGQATSGTWSPILKKNLALAQIETAHAVEGKRLQIEVTVEYRRHTVTATVAKTPFYDPPQKKS